mgnify:CR=1 FL=1
MVVEWLRGELRIIDPGHLQGKDSQITYEVGIGLVPKSLARQEYDYLLGRGLGFSLRRDLRGKSA